MSRSSSIWVAFDHHSAMRATFTVKHEFIDWLKTQDDLTGWKLYRSPDGFWRTLQGVFSPKGDVQLLDAKELLG